MTGQNNPGIDNVDSLYLGYAIGRAPMDASARLAKFGPCIDVWPSGYRTLGFGQAGTERAPSDAISAAVIGGLAIAAEGGSNSATNTLSALRLHAGVTLGSALMRSAFDNLAAGKGRIMTLAIATNLSDEKSTPTLAQTLLGEDRLSGLFGESVQAVRGGNPKVNALSYTNPGEIRQHAYRSLASYLERYYGAGLRPGDPYMLAHAYAALAEQTGVLDVDVLHPYAESPGSRVWVSNLVECCNDYQATFTPGQTLEKMLAPKCFDLYMRARQRGFTNRMDWSGRTPGAYTVNLPEKRRSRDDAKRLQFEEGLDRNDGGPANGQEKGPSLETSDPYEVWRSLIREHVTAFLDCQEALQDHRKRVLAALGGLFNQIPGLRSRNMHLTQGSIRHYASLLTDPTGTRAARDFIQQAGRNPASERADQRPYAVAAAAAGICAAREMSDEGARIHGSFLSKTPPSALESVTDHLLENLDMFHYFGIGSVPPAVLAAYGLKPGEAERFFKCDNLGQPPAYLMQLAADIVSCNGQSLIQCPPSWRQIRLPGKPLEERWSARTDYKNPLANPHIEPHVKQGIVTRARLSLEERQREQQTKIEKATMVADNVRQHLETHYGCRLSENWNPQSPGMLGVLTECRLMEVNLAAGTPNTVHVANARRVINAYNRAGITDPSQLPAKARATYAASLRLAPPPPSSGSEPSILGKVAGAVLRKRDTDDIDPAAKK